MTEKEQKLLTFLRELGWGEITIIVKNGEPVMIEQGIKQTKLD